MKKLSFLTMMFVLSGLVFGQNAESEAAERPTPGNYFLAPGLNVFSNTVLYLWNRYIGQKSWAQISADSIRKNFAGPWEWDRDEFIVNQFGHPYQGSVYHAAARANKFNFYQAILFDAFGSASWELVFETNAPSVNDLISTTMGGAALGEMFHRLYLEIPNPLGVVVSPADGFNDLVTRRRPQYTNNLYRFKLAIGAGYTYAKQSIEEEKDGDFISLNKQSMVSSDIAGTIVYGNPFIQNSMVPYNHFEMALYANFGFPIPAWYNLSLLSDGYLFSFSVFDEGNRQASAGLSMHYDIFADRQIDFFSQALDFTYKYQQRFASGTEMELKGHLGWTVFNADTFYVHDEYSGMRRTENNYGTGANIKFIFAVQNPLWGTLEFKAFVYHVFNVFQNENKDTGSDFCTFFSADYSFPLSRRTAIGIAFSSLLQHSRYDNLPDILKYTDVTRVYFAWQFGRGDA
jgi:hypothetical protein